MSSARTSIRSPSASCPPPSRAAKNASVTEASGCTFASASRAVTWAAATTLPTATPPRTITRRPHPIIRSLEPGEEWCWCYVDDVAFVLPEFTERRGSHPRLSSVDPWRCHGRPAIHGRSSSSSTKSTSLAAEFGGTATETDRRRLEAVKVSLDQCSDLLRQRRALASPGWTQTAPRSESRGRRGDEQ